MARSIAILLATLLLSNPSVEAGSSSVEAIRRHRQENGFRILAEYVELLSLPNVASVLEDVRRNAEWIREALSRRGVRATLLEFEGAPPIVYGEMDSPGAARTLGIYVHYDGQPVQPAAWSTDPWRPTLFTAEIGKGGEARPLPGRGEPIDPEWRLYARSAGDDKAPVAAILAALDGMRESDLAPTSNVRFFFEGEEEAGSPHLREYLERNREKLDPIDLWLICDGPVHASRRPQLVFGVRGITGLDITVYGAKRYLHSGHYGNWAPNPALELARLLSTLKDEDGRVLVEGFLDSVAPLSPAERSALATVPDPDEDLRQELGLARTEGGNAPLKERILLPSLNIRGMAAATVGETARNVIPAIARASLDVRLVPGNDPVAMVELVEEHIRGQGYTIVREEPTDEERLRHLRLVRVERRGGYPAARTSLDHPRVRELIRAARSVAGEDLVLLPGLGGSLPLHLFTELLDRPAVIVPIANHDNNQHGPDENLRLANLWYGIDLLGSVLTMPRSPTGMR